MYFTAKYFAFCGTMGQTMFWPTSIEVGSVVPVLDEIFGTDITEEIVDWLPVARIMSDETNCVQKKGETT